MGDVVLILGLALAIGSGWLGWQMRLLQTRLKALAEDLATRTTELESARLQLQRLSTVDSLTALPNHEQFLEFIEREWRRNRRDKTPVSLIFLDLDHFRAYNREYGRTAGDECLRQVGRALEGLTCRAGDLVARYHSDEFAVVLGATDATGAMRVAEKVRTSIEELRLAPARESSAATVTASVAVASVTPARESPWEELDLIKMARAGLREARALGGNRVVRASIGAIAVPQIASTVTE
jgi:diguanylate cyclase (GGDEF)-like protein